jgi:hypothetical protein
MPHEKHHRCNLCGKDFESGGQLEDHVERRESDALPSTRRKAS